MDLIKINEVIKELPAVVLPGAVTQREEWRDWGEQPTSHRVEILGRPAMGWRNRETNQGVREMERPDEVKGT